MGLDMYLTKRTYVKNWDHMKPSQRHKITIKLGGIVRRDIRPERISEIIEEVAYWRKANAIHKWFVDNCQGGVDDCREAYVEREKLSQLCDLCKQVLATVETVPGKVKTGTTYYPDGRVDHHTKDGDVVAQKNLAKSLLPTQGGFFFGGTDYDECYIQDVRDTVRQLEPLLKEEDGEFYYRASW